MSDRAMKQTIGLTHEDFPGLSRAANDLLGEMANVYGGFDDNPPTSDTLNEFVGFITTIAINLVAKQAVLVNLVAGPEARDEYLADVGRDLRTVCGLTETDYASAFAASQAKH